MKQEIGKTPFPAAGERYLQKCVSDSLTFFSLICSLNFLFGKRCIQSEFFFATVNRTVHNSS